jgi:hypothetical protein
MPTRLIASARVAHVSACFFVVSGLAFLGGIAMQRRSVGNWEANVDLRNNTQLAGLWEGRRAGMPGFLVGDAFEMLGWLLFLPPVHGLGTVLGGSQRSGTGILSACFVVAAVVNIVDFMFQAGSTTVATYWAPFFAAHDTGAFNDDLSLVPYMTPLQTLELNYRMTRSRALWLTALDHLLMTIGFATAFSLASLDNQQPLSKAWRVFTALAAFLTFIGFASGIGRAVEFGDPELDFPLRFASGAYFLVVNTLIVPVWLVLTGCQLSANDGKDYGLYAVRGAERNVEMSSPSLPGPGFA